MTSQLLSPSWLAGLFSDISNHSKKVSQSYGCYYFWIKTWISLLLYLYYGGHLAAYGCGVAACSTVILPVDPVLIRLFSNRKKHVNIISSSDFRNHAYFNYIFLENHSTGILFFGMLCLPIIPQRWFKCSLWMHQDFVKIAGQSGLD